MFCFDLKAIPPDGFFYEIYFPNLPMPITNFWFTELPPDNFRQMNKVVRFS